MALFIAPLSAYFRSGAASRMPARKKPTPESASLCQGQPLHWLSTQCDAPYGTATSISLVLRCLTRAAAAARRGGGATNPAVSGTAPTHSSGRRRWSAAAATPSGSTASRAQQPRCWHR